MYDANPAHIIRECLTDRVWGMGYQSADIDDVAFMAAADRLFDEGMGISILWDKQTSIQDFVAEIITHIDAALYVDRTTGKFVLKLIRPDYVYADLLVLDESNVGKIDNFSRPTLGELVNSVTVEFVEHETQKPGTVTVDDIVLVQLQGAVISQTIRYPGFSCKELATRAAQRDLRALSNPLISCTIYANRDAATLNIGDAFRLTWPDYDLTNVVMRVAGIAYGDGKSNQVRITASQDVFALPNLGIVTPPGGEWVNPIQEPEDLTERVVVEAPYFALVQSRGQSSVDGLLSTSPDAGYLLASAGAPAYQAFDAVIAVDAGSGYVNKGDAPLCAVGFVDGAVSKTATSITLSSSRNLSLVATNIYAQIGQEIVSIVAISGSTLTIGRGVLDTVPAEHADGAAILFIDGASGSNEVEYAASEAIDVKLLPVTISGQLALADATAETVTFDSRAIRPYPPGLFRINSTAYPASVSSGDVTVSWAHRNRTQQTGGTLLTQADASVTTEAGVTYNVEVYNGTTLLGTSSGNTGTSVSLSSSYFPASSTRKIVLYSVRDGFESWQKHEHTFTVT